MENMNKYNFKLGDHVICDTQTGRGYEVIIDQIGKIFATIYTEDNPRYRWEIMINRLSPIES